MKINEKHLTIRGMINTDNEYNHGDEIQVTVVVTDIQDKDNQDGTVDRIYKAKLFGEE